MSVTVAIYIYVSAYTSAAFDPILEILHRQTAGLGSGIIDMVRFLNANFMLESFGIVHTISHIIIFFFSI